MWLSIGKQNIMNVDKPREVFIDPVKVNVTIKHRTDYGSMIVVALIILALGAWGILSKLGVVQPISF
jgi:hypothetical protein